MKPAGASERFDRPRRRPSRPRRSPRPAEHPRSSSRRRAAERVAPPAGRAAEIVPRCPRPVTQRLANGLTVITVEQPRSAAGHRIAWSRSGGAAADPAGQRRARRAHRRGDDRGHGDPLGDRDRPGGRGARRVARAAAPAGTDRSAVAHRARPTRPTPALGDRRRRRPQPGLRRGGARAAARDRDRRGHASR